VTVSLPAAPRAAAGARAADWRARAAREAECTEAAEIDGLAVRAIRLIGPSRPPA
jgi:hypothetical protein